MRYKNMFKNEHGVSEAIGFMLVLGIMVTGIGLVTLYGYPILLQEQKDANVRNMERNMISIQNDLNSLTFKNVPYKESSMQVSGGTLSLQNPYPFFPTYVAPNFTIYANSNQINLNSSGTEYYFYPGDLRFNSDDGDAEILLENGAVNIAYLNEGGSSMLAEPRWYYDNLTDAFVISLIRVHGEDLSKSNGISNIQMKVSQLYPDIDMNIDAPNTVTVVYNYNSENNFKDSWRNFFVNSALGMTQVDQLTYTKTPVSRLVIKSYDIEILNL